MSRTYDDDLFKESTMTFGQHLGELRDCLFKSILGLVVGVIIGLSIGKYVVQFIEHPLQHALEDYYLTKAKDQIRERYPGLSPELLEIVRRDEKIFEEVTVEPGTLLKEIQASYPDTLKDVHLPEYRLQDRDLLYPERLCRTMVADSARETPSAAKTLWNVLDEPQRKLVREIDQASEATAEQKSQFTQLLNDAFAKPAATQASDLNLATAPIDPELLAQIDALAKLPPGENTFHLNWLRLAAVYPTDVGLAHPFLASIRLWRQIKDVQWVRPISISTTEAFMFWVKASFIAGLIIASPWVFFQIWKFIGAGLYPHERKYVYIYLPFSLLLFLAGAALTFFMVFEPVLKFLLKYNDWLGIEPSPRISDWMSFVLWMPLGFGASFQLPLVMLFATKIGAVDHTFFLKQWRFAVLIIFIVSAVLTPSPDPYSMMLMALPLVGLYFGGWLLSWWTTRKRRKVRVQTE
jgi:sec-independent protein translocase protein TatC